MTEPTNQQIDRILLNVKRSGYIQVFNELEKSRAQAERLADALKRAEQTIRNLGNGWLSGDGQEIALNEARNICEALEDWRNSTDVPS